MKICKKCDSEKQVSEFYKNDSSCKECRKAMVRENRAIKADYYREYDRQRFKSDPRVKERHARYLSTEKGMQASIEAKRKWMESNPVKRAAQTILGNAVRDKRIKKPGFCESCGKTGRIHGHHCDYAKPLDVIWLCPKCHKEWHEKNGEGLNGA